MTSESKTYDEIKERLNTIADLVSADDIDLEEALSLYEEAAKLGIAACDMSEKDIFVSDGEEVSDETEKSDEAGKSEIVDFESDEVVIEAPLQADSNDVDF